MTNEQAISIMTIQRPRTGTKEKLEAYEMAIKALEQKPCGDCVSREEVLNIIYRYGTPSYESGNNYIENSDALYFEIKQLSSVKPQPKIGEWLKNGELCRCSNCHSLVLRSVIKSYNYCFRCGAKMEVSE